jgi:hypothetical protein
VWRRPGRYGVGFVRAAPWRTEARSAASRTSSDARVRRRTSWIELGTHGAQLVGLSAFALSQPLFDLLSRNAEFFAVRGSTPADIVLFALAVTVVPPLALLALEVLAGLVDRRLRHRLHLVFLACLVGLLAIQALKKADGLGSLPILIGTALLVAIAVTAYSRLQPVRRVLTVLAPASLLFLALFLFFSPVSKLVFPPDPQVAQAASGSRFEAPPIVFVIFDEFPVTAIMTSNGRIDSVRYPNIAAFARDATWFRNATTVSWETVHAVPALLTGRRPEEDLLPVFADHPRNLFTLLRGKYQLNATETNTHLCPRAVCDGEAAGDLAGRMGSLLSDVGVLYAHMVVPPTYERRLPSVTTGWGDFLRDADDDPGARGVKLDKWRAFLASIRTSERPTLNFLHVLLPHEPWQLLPSCHSNVFHSVRKHTPGLPPGDLRWQPDEWLVSQAHQRLLLQAECVDALVGQLVEKLRTLGLYDSALVVLASDHGVAVRPGELRRHVEPDSPTNLADIAFPVVVVKRPGQRNGEVIDRHVETIDVLPSVSEIAGVPIPWHVDGRPLWDEGSSLPQVRIRAKDALVTAPIGLLRRKRDALVQRQVRIFGEGDDEPGIFGIGPHPELIGRALANIQRSPAVDLEAEIADEVSNLLADFPRGSTVVPTPIYGSLVGQGAKDRFPIAVAVNGRIAGVSWTDGRGSTGFSAFLPEDSFRPGRNRVQVFAIADRPNGVALLSLGGS